MPPAGNAVPRQTPRHQQLIVTIYGLYGRANGGALPVSVLISMLDDLGVESSGVRSSVSRLKRRGVLESVSQGGVAAYRLAPNLEDVFQEGDRRIFSPRRATAADRWLLIAFSVPESQRHLRHQLRSMLTRMGFGSVTPGLWIAPGNTYEDISHQLERPGLTEYVEFFKAEHLTAGDVKDKVSRWWDLPALESLYAEFIERFAPVLERWEPAGAAGARARRRPGGLRGLRPAPHPVAPAALSGSGPARGVPAAGLARADRGADLRGTAPSPERPGPPACRAAAGGHGRFRYCIAGRLARDPVLALL